MQREILFRGFHKEENGKETIYIDGQPIKGKWVEGYFCLKSLGVKKKVFAIQDPYGMHEVIPETIGQCTGLDDKNGKKIFENANVEFSYDYFTGDFDTKVGKGTVKFIYGIFYIIPYEIEERKVKDIENEEWFPIYHVNLEELEVIGTIFDKEVKDNE